MIVLEFLVNKPYGIFSDSTCFWAPSSKISSMKPKHYNIFRWWVNNDTLKPIHALIETNFLVRKKLINQCFLNSFDTWTNLSSLCYIHVSCSYYIGKTCAALFSIETCKQPSSKFRAILLHIPSLPVVMMFFPREVTEVTPVLSWIPCKVFKGDIFPVTFNRDSGF